MTYFGMPVIIPMLASGYLLAIYLLLMLAQRIFKSSRYASNTLNTLTDAYAAYPSTEQASKLDELESSQPQKIQQASSVR